MLKLEIEQAVTTVWQRYEAILYKCEHAVWKRCEQEYGNEITDLEINVHVITTNDDDNEDERYVSSVAITDYEDDHIWLSFGGCKDTLTAFANELVAFNGTLTVTAITELASKHEVRREI